MADLFDRLAGDGAAPQGGIGKPEPKGDLFDRFSKDEAKVVVPALRSYAGELRARTPKPIDRVMAAPVPETIEQARARDNVAEPEEGWLDISRKFFERIGPSFKQMAGGAVQGMIESAATSPMPGAPLSTSEIAGLRDDMQAAIKETRARGIVPGQALYKSASADLEANAYSSGNTGFKKYVPMVAEAVTQMVPALAASFATRNPSVAGSVMGAQVFGQQYGESAEMGRDSGQALRDAAFMATAEAIGEKIPVGMLMKPGGNFLKSTLKTMGAEGVQEMFTQILQTGYDKGVLNPEMTWGEAVAQVRDAGIVGTFTGGALSVGVQGTRATANVIGKKIIPGIRERAAQMGAQPTPEDIASPLDTADIVAGKAEVAKASASGAADEVLAKNGAPTIGRPVTVQMPDGRAMNGVVEDAFSTDVGEFGAADGIKIKLEDGSTFSEHFEALRDAGVNIAERGPIAEADALDAALAARANQSVADAGAAEPAPAEPAVDPTAAGSTPRPVDDAKAITAQVHPGAVVTSSRRGKDDPLTKANPKSWHARSGAAVDVRPIDGMTFEQFVQGYRDAGYSILEAINETGKGKTAHATGDHWHVVLGGTGSAQVATDKETLTVEPAAAPEDTDIIRATVDKGEANADLAGEDIDAEWSRFAPDSGTLGIPRADMPQIKAEHRGAMVNFVNARGVAHEEVTLPAADLKPSQAEFSREKVKKALDYTGGDRAILISNDGYVLDGHHQWLAARAASEDVRAIRLNAPISQLIDTVKQFPSAASEGVDGQKADAGAAVKASEERAQNTSVPQGGGVAPSAEAAKAGGPEATANDGAASAGGAVATTTSTQPSQAAGATVEDMPSGKSVIVKGASAAEMAAIKAALPEKVVPLENAKAGGIVYSKKHEAKIRAALAKVASDPGQRDDLMDDPEMAGYERRAGIRMSRDEIAERLASLLGHTRGDMHNGIGRAIHERDFWLLNSRLGTQNAKSRQVFTEATGIRLPSTKAGTEQTLRDWAGVSQAEIDKVRSNADAKRKAESAERDRRYRRHDAESITVRLPDGTTTTGAKWVDDRISEGFNRLVNTSTGAVPKWAIANSKGQGYPIKKELLAYARDVLAERGPDVTGPDGLTNAERNDPNLATPEELDHLFGNTGAATEKPRDRSAAIIIDPAAGTVKTVPLGKSRTSAADRKPEGKRQIGANAKGFPLYEDENGVRSYVERGIRITEPVELRPTRDRGMVMSVNPSDRRSEFLTNDERNDAALISGVNALDIPQEQKDQALRELADGDATLAKDLIRIQADAAPTPPAKSAEPQKSSKFAKNTLFTEDKVEAARQRMRDRMNRLNSGVDPEMLIDGMVIAGAHIEAGIRNFAQFAKEMRDDFGEKITPYLLSFWEGARNYPGLDTANMTTPDVSRAMHEMMMAEQKPADSAPAAPSGDPVEALRDRFLNGDRFATIVEARKAVEELTGQPVKPGTPEAKRADEMIEAAVVQAAQRIVARGRPAMQTYRDLVDLYQRQPALNVRSSTSIEQQAYSTPVPLAYLASQRAGITNETTVYEPSAGNGALLIGADSAKVVANELNPDRAKALEESGLAAEVSRADATTFTPRGKFDVVIENPPFGVLKDDDGENRIWNLGGGYETREIDHVIAMKSLESMKDDGSAVLIVGGLNKQISTEEGRANGYNAKAKREFYYRLYSEYNVTDHFTVAGELYARQGAGWPVDVIVIKGRGKSSLPLPAVKPPRQYGSWEALEETLAGRPSLQSPAGAETGDADSQRAGPAGGDERSGASRRGGRTDRQPVDAQAQRPGDVRERPAGGEPGRSRLGERQAGNNARAADSERPQPARRPSPVAAEGQRQVPYQPASTGRSLDTLVPVNMQTAIGAALGQLEQRVGQVDAFVADKLGYAPSDIPNYFSAEQVDALALALDNMEAGKGFIIGDQTGIGKGRVVAGIIRYAMANGRMPIFVTEKPNLYADMYRDMNDIGIPEMLGRKVNIVMTNAAEKVPLDEDGADVLKTPAATQHNAALNRIADGDREGVDVLFTTYAQMQSQKGEWTPRQRAIQRLADGAILIFDESHNAGGQGSAANSQRKSKKKGEGESAGMEAPNRATFARQIAKQAHGVFFSSATYAKRPEVMDLYSSTDMKLAVADIDNLAGAITKGGIPMQQVVATMLTEAGQYVRRERSFEGVEYRTPAVKVDRAAYSKFTGVLRGIQDFQEQFVSPATKEISKEIRAEAAAVSFDGSVGSAGATSTNFTSVMHNIVEQMLLSMKAEPAAERAIEAIKAGKKPVITVANTMGSFIDEYAEENDIGNGQPMPLDFGALLMRYLDRTRRIVIKKPFSKEKGTVKILSDADLGPAGVAAYRQVAKMIRSLNLENVPVSPVDWIKHRIQQAGYTVGEITGRGATIDYGPDVPVYRVRPGTERSISGRRKAITGFNNGSIDAMILNQAGSTGLSLHASSTFKDQRKRLMIVAQAERNIDTHMQMLGRIHRTGQVVLPEYDQLVAAVPAEMRPAAVLAKKMASLNANTTGARGSAMSGDDVPDFMNQYGDEIAARLMEEDFMLHKRLAEPLKASEGDEDGLSREDAARKVTGRLMLLPLDEQEAFYERFLSEYQDFLAQKEAAGESALEAKTLPLDAKPIATQQIIGPTHATSPFGGAVDMETMDIKRLGKPMTAAQVLTSIEATIGATVENADDMAKFSVLQARGRRWMVDMRAGYLDQFDDYRRAQLDDLDEKKVDATRERLDTNRRAFEQLTNNLYPGATVALTSDESDAINGIVIGFEKKGQTKNPLALGSYRVTIAIADAAQRVTVPLSQLHAGNMPLLPGARTVIPVQTIDGVPMLQALDEMQTEAREQRVIFTGNILAAFEHVNGKGQILNFIGHDGSVRAGIMMKRGYDHAKEQANQPIAFRTVDQVMAWLQAGEIAFGDHVSIELRGQTVTVTAAAAKSVGGQYFLDAGVRRALGGDFFKKSTGMVAEAPLANLSRIVAALQAAGATFRAKTNLDKAREIVSNSGVVREERTPFQPAAQTDTPEFKRWFGDSKVVDKEGKPLVVYHGTASDFSVFQLSPRNAAIWASPYPESASRFAGGDLARAGGSPNVMPVYMSLQNPFDPASPPNDLKDAIIEEMIPPWAGKTQAAKIRAHMRREWKAGDFQFIFGIGNGFVSDSVRAMMKRMGIDGLIRRDSDGRVAYAAFDPTQIKSATGNNGQFDPANPSIVAEPRDQEYAPSNDAASRQGNDPGQPVRRDQRAVPASDVDGRPGDAGAVRRDGLPVLRGLGIAARFERAGATALVGETVTHPSELAEIAQIYRDPRHETLRVFFTKGSKIVHATAVSTRSASSSPLLPGGLDVSAFPTWAKETMAAAGADGFYMLHNHPSGVPEPSPQDKKVTASIAASTPGFKAHIVINSNQYGHVDARGNGSVHAMEKRVDELLSPSKPNPILGELIGSGSALATVAKSVQVRQGEYVTAILTGTKNEVRAVVDVPRTYLDKPDVMLLGALRRYLRMAGAERLFIVGATEDLAHPNIRRALREKVVTAVVNENGIASGNSDMTPDFLLGGPVRVVADEREPFAFDDAETEKRFQDAKEGLATKETIIERAQQFIEMGWHGLTRHWIALPNLPKYAQLQQWLRNLEAAPQSARERAIRMLEDVTDGFTPEDMDLFTRKVVLDDLVWDAANERELPFGFTPSTLAAEKAKIDAILAADPDQKVWKAAMKRKLANRRVADELVKAGVLEAERIKNPAYYRHQVLEYARAEQQRARSAAGMAKRLRTPKWAKRMGSTMDINANLLEAEFEWLAKALTDIPVARTIEKIKRSEHNILDQLRSDAKESNRAGVAAALANAQDVIDDPAADENAKGRAAMLIDQEKAFRVSIARGFDIVRRALKSGAIQVPARFESAAGAIEMGTAGGDPPFNFLAWMMDENQEGAVGAGMVMKAIGQRRAWTQRLLGKAYIDPDNASELAKRLAPEGYTTWQPDEGKLLFTIKTLPEHVIDRMIEKMDAPEGVDPAELRVALEQTRQMMAMGGDRYTMILPQEVADTLNQLRRVDLEGLYDFLIHKPMRAWKRWVLINPRRFIKYNINNLSGDLDAVLAGNPRLLRRVGEAARELAAVMRGRATPSARYQEAVERGVFDSGLSIQEIPDINQFAAFERLAGNEKPLSKIAMLPLRKAWNALQSATQWRENVFRYAAYLDYADRIERGEQVGYGASVPAMVDAVTDMKDRAALLARDLIGDYGAISHFGGGLRRSVIPFWSWMEINTRRYWRLSANAYSQGIGKGLATGTALGVAAGARTTAWLAIRAAMVYGIIQVWNHLFFDDEEQELSDEQRQQLHVILGRNDAGEIITLRTQGALSDALSWFGIGPTLAAFKDYEAGRGDLWDVMSAPFKAPVNKVGTALSPVITLPMEAATGKKLWPDLFNTRANRDPWRNVFSTLSLENEYDALLDKPTRGYGRSWQEAVVYRRDPGEMAYNEARSIAYDWLSHVKGQEGSSSITTPRSEALRNYRTALRFGDEDAATKALEQMAALGMTKGDLAASIKRAAPLGPIAKKDRRAFIDGLSDEEYATFQRAQVWYDQTFR